MDQKQAIELLKAGNPAGLEALVRAYQLQAVRVAFLMVWNREQAEDIVQAAFLRVYERIQQFDPQRAFGPWFLKIVVNDALKAAARQRGQVSGDLARRVEEDSFFDFISDPAPGPEETLQREELRATVRNAMALLTPEQRAAVVSRYYLGLSQAEMVAELGVPASTIKWRLHAARKRLAILLQSIGERR
jgi:RNA polymerase sigma-70 factor (ECF subfamily)